METTSSASSEIEIANLEDENSLPGLSIEEVNLNSPRDNNQAIETICGKKSFDELNEVTVRDNDDDNDIDDQMLLAASEKQLKLDGFFSRSNSESLAPPNKKIKQ